MGKGEILFEPDMVNVNLDKLKLDLCNVRFTHIREKLTEKQMENEIWGEVDTRSLYDQIISAKGLYEKPVINSNFIVVEGNRRVVCLRRLKKLANTGKLPAFSKNYFDNIECEMVPRTATQDQINLYLAVEHVKGKKEWPTFNRAKMIYNLNKINNHSYDFLAKHLGMGKVTLIRYADVYEQTDRYGNLFKDEKDWYHKFTYFDELYKRKDLKDFRTLQQNVDKFAYWVHDGKFSDVRDVRRLANVLDDEDALKVLERANFREALQLVDNKNPALKSKEFKKIAGLIELIRSFPRRELIKTMQDPARRGILETLRKEIDSLLRDIDSMK